MKAMVLAESSKFSCQYSTAVSRSELRCTPIFSYLFGNLSIPDFPLKIEVSVVLCYNLTHYVYRTYFCISIAMAQLKPRLLLRPFTMCPYSSLQAFERPSAQSS